MGGRAKMKVSDRQRQLGDHSSRQRRRAAQELVRAGGRCHNFKLSIFHPYIETGKFPSI